MRKNRILENLLKESQLFNGGFLGTDVFFYLAGRYPELTIEQAVNVVKLAREECANGRQAK